MALCCKKGRWSISGRTIATANNYTAMVLSITVLRRDEIVAVVPPPAGSASSGDVTPSRKHSFLKLNDLASSRAHSRNCHNAESSSASCTHSGGMQKVVSEELSSLCAGMMPSLSSAFTFNANVYLRYSGILVSSEVSHRAATMVSCNFVPKRWLAHSGYPFGEKEPRNPAGPLRHMCHMAPFTPLTSIT